MVEASNSHFHNVRAFGNAECTVWLSTSAGWMAAGTIVGSGRVDQKPTGSARRYRPNQLTRSGLRTSKTTTDAPFM